MANEAVLVNKLGEPIDFIVDTTGAIAKGSFLKLVDPRTASGAALIAAPCAGIARREKISADGRTRLSLFGDGIFRVMASGSVAIGAPLQMAENNYIMTAPWSTLASGAVMIGTALEAATDDTTFEMALKLR